MGFTHLSQTVITNSQNRCPEEQSVIDLLVYLFSESIYHDVSWPTLQLHDSPGLENEILEFHVYISTC